MSFALPRSPANAEPNRANTFKSVIIIFNSWGTSIWHRTYLTRIINKYAMNILFKYLYLRCIIIVYTWNRLAVLFIIRFYENNLSEHSHLPQGIPLQIPQRTLKLLKLVYKYFNILTLKVWLDFEERNYVDSVC